MHAFEVLGDPVRRRILELLAEGERAAGDVTDVVRSEFGISQPAVSLHLRVLRDTGFASMRPSGARRLYAVETGPFREIDAWLERYGRSWLQNPGEPADAVHSGGRKKKRKHGKGKKR